jgi:probable phosphoglycerate mutase
VTHLLLARHGLAHYESDRMTDHGGWLTAEGRAQARALGVTARQAGVVAVWSSPLSRAVQTAEIAAGALGVAEVVVREGLREYGVGVHAGRPSSEETALLWPVFEAWVAGDDTAEIPGGERISAQVARMTTVLEEVAAAGGPALVVSHGGVVMATVTELVGAPRSSAMDLVLPGGGHVDLRRDADGWTVK